MTASYKQLLDAKYNYEAHLYDVNLKLYKLQQEGKPLSKQQKHLERKAELELKLAGIMVQLEPYLEQQKRLQQQLQKQQQQQQKIGEKPVLPTPPPDIRDTNTQAFIEAGVLGLILNRRKKKTILQQPQQEIHEEEEEEKKDK
jgi:hypothetical protein